MTSGGAYYQTAVELRAMANTARTSYPEALELTDDQHITYHQQARRFGHAALLIVQAVGFELAAAGYCIAQSIEDGSQP